MKIIETNREQIYLILAAIYKELKIEPVLAEVGVLKGLNAEAIYDSFQPAKMFLIDHWSKSNVEEYRRINSHREWVNDPKEYEFYYGGDIDEQKTYDAIFEAVNARFVDKPNVEIVRSSSAGGYNYLVGKKLKDFHYIYVDASHSYEDVLDDLMSYKNLLHQHLGCIQLNDCCHSDAGVLQNFGVLEAANKFCKIAGYSPILAVNRDFTDVLLAPTGSVIGDCVDKIVELNNYSCVEVPNSLFPNLSVKVGKRPMVSFI